MTATATHIGFGKCKGIPVDANMKGRRTTEEINNNIEKAEEMKERDEAEENRVMAKLELFPSATKLSLRHKM